MMRCGGGRFGLDQEECEEEIIHGPPIIEQREVDRFLDLCDIRVLRRIREVLLVFRVDWK
jgi:hypothetical protein